jgi:hypothetical protein
VIAQPLASAEQQKELFALLGQVFFFFFLFLFSYSSSSSLSLLMLFSGGQGQAAAERSERDSKGPQKEGNEEMRDAMMRMMI